MNETMYNAAEAVYESTFYNLSWHKRRMPTAFYPMLSRSLPDDRVRAMLPLLTDPLGFCVNDTAFGAGVDANSRALVTFFNASQRDNVLCLSDACVGDAVNERYVFVRQEGLAQLPVSAAAPGTLPLNQWRHSVTRDHALTAGATPPAPGYELVRTEGLCFADADAAPGLVPITLWFSESRGDFQTCAGNPACLADAAGNGYVLQSTQCFGFNGTTAEQLPCRFGVPSTARSDLAYFEQKCVPRARALTRAPHLTAACRLLLRARAATGAAASGARRSRWCGSACGATTTSPRPAPRGRSSSSRPSRSSCRTGGYRAKSWRTSIAFAERARTATAGEATRASDIGQPALALAPRACVTNPLARRAPPLRRRFYTWGNLLGHVALLEAGF